MPLRIDPVEEARDNWRKLGEQHPAPGMGAVMRAGQILLNEANRALRPLGLNFARYEVLMLLTFSRTGALPLGKVGERLQVHPTSVTNTVDRLEMNGLVERVGHAEDRRTILAQITPAGRELAKKATDALRAARLSITALDDDEIEQLHALLLKLRVAAQDFELPAQDEDPSRVATPAAGSAPRRRPRNNARARRFG